MDLLNIKEGPGVGKAKKILDDLKDEYGSKLTKEMASKELKDRFQKKASIAKELIKVAEKIKNNKE